MDDTHVDGELATVVVENDDADGATARLEGLVETGPEVRLINDWEGLLDITGLGHGNNSTIGQVKDTVLLEDWTKHGLDNNRWGWGGDEGGVLVELLGEQVNTEKAVLAGSLGGADLDNLAWTVLEHHNVTLADMVGWYGDGVWDALTGAGRGTGVDIHVDVWLGATVDHTIGGAVKSLAERVVVTILIVVTHLVVVDNFWWLDG